MIFPKPAVIMVFLKVPVCAKAFRILQAVTNSLNFSLLAKCDNSGKISASTNDRRPSSDSWAIIWHMSNTRFLHSSSEIKLWGLQGHQYYRKCRLTIRLTSTTRQDLPLCRSWWSQNDSEATVEPSQARDKVFFRIRLHRGSSLSRSRAGSVRSRWQKVEDKRNLVLS